MRASNGIFAKTQTDDTTAVLVASPEIIASTLAGFDPSVPRKLYAEFDDGETDFQAIISHIQGQSLSPRQIRTTLQPFITHVKSPSQASVALDEAYELSLLGSSSGTLVQIDANNYFYNVAYQSPIVQSGRSYGIAPSRGLLDQSDSGYLKELDSYVKSTTPSDGSNFYTVLLQLLTESDSIGMSGLSSSGQVVGTDFLTIYTAELIRHNMVNLDVATDPWEIDLGEVTLLTDYGAAAGMVMVNGKLILGTANVYGTKAIGETRKDFTNLAKQITSFENTNHPDLISTLNNLTPIQDQTIAASVSGDVFRRILVYLNRPEFQQSVQSNSASIIDATTAVLNQARADSSQITAYIQAHPTIQSKRTSSSGN
jgi:hypothetical protein